MLFTRDGSAATVLARNLGEFSGHTDPSMLTCTANEPLSPL